MIIKGLNNKGNTCYMNSALQILLHNEDLVNYFMKINFTNKNLLAIKNFIKTYHSQNDNHLNLLEIKQIVGNDNFIFSGFAQNDSTEFILLLLNIIEDDLKKENKKKVIESIYEIHTEQILKCKLKRCNNISITKSNHKFLKLDILNIDNQTLDDCYRNYKQPYKLKEDNRWFCDKCNKKRIASKRNQVFKWPKNLLIQLKRFTMNGSRSIKNTNHVDIPLIWRRNYILKGMIIHSGTLRGGHYIAIIKFNDKWHLCNDSQIKKIGNLELNNYKKNAYMLYYTMK